MESWRPQTDFEQEIVAMQPDYNFIYGELTDRQRNASNRFQPRPQSHIDHLETRRKDNKNGNTQVYSHPLHMIRTVQTMSNSKRVGELPTLKDWDTRDTVEEECIGMIRHCGMGPSVDLPLNEGKTIPTKPIRDNVHIIQNGKHKFPVIFDDSYFVIESSRIKAEKLRAELGDLSESPEPQINAEMFAAPETNEEEFEYICQAAIEEHNQFLHDYPTLNETKQKSKSKGKKKANTSINGKSSSSSSLSSSTTGTSSVGNVNAQSTPLQYKANKTKKASQQKSKAATLQHSSNNSSSVYNGYETSTSDVSQYYTANDTLNSSGSLFDDAVELRNTNITTKQTEKERAVEFSSKNSKKYYTPMEVYKMKRSK